MIASHIIIPLVAVLTAAAYGREAHEGFFSITSLVVISS